MAACHDVIRPGPAIAHGVTWAFGASPAKVLMGYHRDPGDAEWKAPYVGLGTERMPNRNLSLLASLAKLRSVCLCFWMTEMFFHGPPPSFFA